MLSSGMIRAQPAQYDGGETMVCSHGDGSTGPLWSLMDSRLLGALTDPPAG